VVLGYHSTLSGNKDSGLQKLLIDLRGLNFQARFTPYAPH